jgi:hypothetical protein
VYPLIFLPPTSDGLPEREREVHVSGRLQHIWNKNGKKIQSTMLGIYHLWVVRKINKNISII